MVDGPAQRARCACRRTVRGAVIAAEHPDLGALELRCEGDPTLLFTENETNTERLWGSAERVAVREGRVPRVRRATGEHGAVNPARTGTKAAAHYVARRSRPAAPRVVHVRLCRRRGASRSTSADVERVFASRIAEADEFYASITPAATPADEATVMRQALAGMLWGKQLYFFDLDRWLEEHHVHPLRRSDGPSTSRNQDWFHMVNDDVISMPDTWEYPWYASWDLAFHTVALAMVDIDFAKSQLELMLRELYLHPSGQLPAYEWNFSDVNPPVHAWATLPSTRPSSSSAARATSPG